MRLFSVLALGVLVFGTWSATAAAAGLYMDPNQAELKRGDVMTVSLRISPDTETEECINTVDGVVTYTKNIEPIDVSRGNSIFTLWAEEPTINKKDRTITFAAGIPNGYCGRVSGDPQFTNNVVDIVFMSPGLRIGAPEGTEVATIAYAEETRVLLNDGRGTDAEVRLFGSEITLSPEIGTQTGNEWLTVIAEDNRPPEAFTIELARVPDEDAWWHIIFNTTDKQSGISHYEVMEEPLEFRNLFIWGRADAPWRQVKSPYKLRDQSLNSTIYVRAIDKAGNEYMATLVPDPESRTTPVELYLTAGVVLVGLFTLGVIGFVFWWYRRRCRRLASAALQPRVEREDTEFEE